MEIISSTLDLLLQEACKNNQYQQMLKDASKKFSLGHLKLEMICPQNIKEIIEKRSGQGSSPISLQTQVEKGFHWCHFEFKAFVWVLIIYAALKNKEIDKLEFQDLTFLQSLFPTKPLEFLLFSVHSISKTRQTSKAKWTQQQNDLLTLVMKESQGKYHWSQVSYSLFVKSGCTIFKPREKCREQWVNHLDPDIRKEKWTREQDILLFSSLNTVGKKWSKLARLFKGTRNEHMVKNRYNSLVHKHKDRYKKETVTAIEKKIMRQLEKRAKRAAKKEMNRPLQEEVQVESPQGYQQIAFQDLRPLEAEEEKQEEIEAHKDGSLHLEPIPGWDFSLNLQDVSDSEEHRCYFREDIFFHLI